jgi:hypothetical protein
LPVTNNDLCPLQKSVFHVVHAYRFALGFLWKNKCDSLPRLDLRRGGEVVEDVLDAAYLSCSAYRSSSWTRRPATRTTTTGMRHRDQNTHSRRQEETSSRRRLTGSASVWGAAVWVGGATTACEKREEGGVRRLGDSMTR